MIVGFKLPMQSVPTCITTNVVSLNPAKAIQLYAIKFDSDLQQVCGFPPSIN